MSKRPSRPLKPSEGGFTLIELLVVIIILGILSAVVVFAVRGTGDKGAASAYATDAKTLRTAEEAFCAKFGRYGTMEELSGQVPVNGETHKFLSEPSTLHKVFPGQGGPCRGAGNLDMSSLTVTCDSSKAGCGSGGAIPKGAGYWSSTGNMAFPRYEAFIAALPNGKVLAAGGRTGASPFANFQTAELYDPVTGTWAPTGDMTENRWLGTATVLQNGTVLLAGGFGAPATGVNQQPVLNTAEIYDPATGTFTATGSMAFRRAIQTAVLLPDGRVLVAGGRSCSAAPPVACNSTFVTNTSELYDPATGTFSRTSNNLGNGADNPDPGVPPVPCSGTACNATAPQVGRHTTAGVILSTNCGPNCDKVLMPAGFTGVSNTTADIYDIATGTWTANRPTLVTSRSRQGAMLLQSGKVLLAAGGTGVSTATSELFDPITSTFSLTGSTASIRFNYFYKVLPDGTVLIAGGNAAPSINTAELYDPATGLWKSAGNLRAPQGTSSSNANTREAVLLTVNCGSNCGKVLIVGQSPTGAAGLYTPGV